MVMDLEEMAQDVTPEVSASYEKEVCNESVSLLNYVDVNIKVEPEESENSYLERCSSKHLNVEEYLSSVQVTNGSIDKSEILVPLEDLGVSDAINLKEKSILNKKYQDKSYKCDHCNFTCVYEQDYIQHIKIHFTGKLHNCDVCDYGTNIRKYFTDHVRKHINKPYKCILCNYSFHKPSELRNHVIIKHSDLKAFKCEYCEYTCKLKKMLKSHMRTHQPEKKILCKYCDFLCHQNSDLVTHTFYKHREYCTANTFKCEECGKEFIKQRELRIHYATHTKQYFNHCSECSYSCSRKDILELHIKKYHTKQEKEVKCPKCDYTCFNHTQLNRHSVVHTDMRYFSCDLCDYVCRKKFTLQEHQVKEHNTKCINADSKAKCDKCEYVAVDKRELSRHSVIHTGDNFLRCEHCQYVCRGKKTLKNHQLKEHKDKGSNSKLRCNKCDYIATDIRDIKRHSVVHTGDNFFKCEHCQYVCRRKKTLNVHKLKQHSNDNKNELQQSFEIYINESPLENHEWKQQTEKGQPITSIGNSSNTNLLNIENNKDTLNDLITESLKDTSKDICKETASNII